MPACPFKPALYLSVLYVSDYAFQVLSYTLSLLLSSFVVVIVAVVIVVTALHRLKTWHSSGYPASRLAL